MIPFADQLSSALSLPLANDASTSRLRVDKFQMQQACLVNYTKRGLVIARLSRARVLAILKLWHLGHNARLQTLQGMRLKEVSCSLRCYIVQLGG